MLYGVRRLQILMDEELDDELERLAARERKSKSALIRELVRKQVKPLPPLEQDPLWRMVGADSFEPADVDEVVYGIGMEHGKPTRPVRRRRLDRRRARSR